MPFLLAGVAASFGSHSFGGGIMRASIEPPRERLPPKKPVRLADEVCENQLGHILGEMRIAIHLPQRRRIDEIKVALN